jgi:hypothetical protein
LHGSDRSTATRGLLEPLKGISLTKTHVSAKMPAAVAEELTRVSLDVRGSHRLRRLENHCTLPGDSIRQTML